MNLVLVNDVLLVGRFIAREHVEANHASHKVGADVLLPCLLRPAESNLDFSRLVSLQFERVPGVEGPGKFLSFLLELLLVQMAASCRPLIPLARNDLVPGVF